MSTVLTEQNHTGEGLLSELPGYQSRDRVTLAASQTILAMMVLGVISAPTYAGVSAAAVGNTGNGTCTMANPSTGAGVRAGVYRVTCIEPAANAGTFEVADPDGVIIGTAGVGVAVTGVVKFTIADGATDFVAGDAFNITVTATASGTDGEYKAYDPTATDGSQTAAAIAYAPYVTGAGETKQIVVVARHAELISSTVVFPTGISDPNKAAAIAALKTKGIFLR